MLPARSGYWIAGTRPIGSVCDHPARSAPLAAMLRFVLHTKAGSPVASL